MKTTFQVNQLPHWLQHQMSVWDGICHVDPDPPSDDPAPTPDSAPTDNGDAQRSAAEQIASLNSTVRALRSEIKQLKLDKQSFADTLAERDERIRDRDSQIETLTHQTETLTHQTETLTKQNSGLRVDLALDKVLADANPDKRVLLENTARLNLTLSDEGTVQTIDGRSLDEYRSELQTNFPDMFLSPQVSTGTGSTPSTGTDGGTYDTTPAVSADDGVISGVDPSDIIEGRVTIR